METVILTCNEVFVTGIIDEENAVVEIKCFPSLARKNLNIITASENANFPLHLENNVLVMNKKHNYYYQVSYKYLFFIHKSMFLDNLCSFAIIILILGPGSIANH